MNKDDFDRAAGAAIGAFIGGVLFGGFFGWSGGLIEGQNSMNDYRDQPVTLGAEYDERCQINTTAGTVISALTKDVGLGFKFVAYPVMCQKLIEQREVPATCDNPDRCS